MGTEVLLLAAGTALALGGQVAGAFAARDQAEAEIGEVERQRVEVTRKAQEDKSDRARAADKQFASMVTQMEAIGGAGSQNEQQLGQEIGANSAIDLARIEGNRSREVAGLTAQANAIQQKAVATQESAIFGVGSTLLDFGSGLSGLGAREAGQAAEVASKKDFALGGIT